MLNSRLDGGHKETSIFSDISLFYLVSALSKLWQNTASRFPLSQTPKTTHDKQIRLVVSLIFGQGYYTFLNGHTKPNREGGRKENKHELGLAPSARREKFVTFLCRTPCVCRLSQECITTKFPQSYLECWLILSRWPTRYLSPQVLAAALLDRQPPPDFGRLFCSASFTWLLLSLDWLLLPTGFFSRKSRA